MKYRQFSYWLERFHEQNCFIRPEWVRYENMELFVRSCTRMIGAVELANLTLRHPKYLGTGNFKRFLDQYDEQVPFLCESILNPKLAGHLITRGWTVYYDPYWNSIPAALNPLFVKKQEYALFDRRCTVLTTTDVLTEMAEIYDNVIASHKVPQKPIAS